MVLPLIGLGCHTLPTLLAVRSTPTQLPTTSRASTDPDVSALGSAYASQIPTRPNVYRRLTAEECRQLAIENAPLADDLDSHPENAPTTKHFRHQNASVANLSRLVRGYAADEIRNRAAAETLELFYRLAAAEGQFDRATETHAELRRQLTEAEKAAASGLKGADVHRIRRTLLETESQLAKLEAGIAALNAGLAGRLGLNPADPNPIWPADALRVGGEVPDVEQAVATGLHYRPDLNLLRVMSQVDQPPGRLANAVLAAVNPLLGQTEPPTLFATLIQTLKKEPIKAEVAMRKQLHELLVNRERQVEAEVRVAVATLQGERFAVAAKTADIQHLAAQVSEWESKVAAGLAGATAELAVAKLNLLKAKSELIQAVADWQIANVKLRQATGMLVRE